MKLYAKNSTLNNQWDPIHAFDAEKLYHEVLLPKASEGKHSQFVCRSPLLLHLTAIDGGGSSVCWYMQALLTNKSVVLCIKKNGEDFMTPYTTYKINLLETDNSVWSTTTSLDIVTLPWKHAHVLLVPTQKDLSDDDGGRWKIACHPDNVLAVLTDGDRQNSWTVVQSRKSWIQSFALSDIVRMCCAVPEQNHSVPPRTVWSPNGVVGYVLSETNGTPVACCVKWDRGAMPLGYTMSFPHN